MTLPSLSRTARYGVLVTLVFAFIHGRFLEKRYEPNSWLFADGAFYFVTVRAVAHHGRLEQRDLQPQSWYTQKLGWNNRLTDDWSNVSLGKNGGWYPKHPILLPLSSVPLYLIYGTIGTLITNVLLNWLFVMLIFLIGKRFARVEVSALVACVAAWMPFVQNMSYTFSNDLLGAVLILGAIECTFANLLGWAGVLAGLSLWSRVTNAAFLPALVIVGWDVGGWRAVRRAILFSLIPLAVYGALNTYLFGAPWSTSYQNVIVREGGVAKTASHSRLFNVPWNRGFNRIVFGNDGAFRTFQLLIPGMIGFIAYTIRRWRISLAFVLFAVLPMLAFVKYDWYRPHFLYPVFGLGSVGVTMLIGLLLKPKEQAPTPKWSPAWRVAATVGVVTLIATSALAYRHSQRRDPKRLSTWMNKAEVKLDDIPCDYWNPQVERWECAGSDGSGWAMTGRMLTPYRVRGEHRQAIWLHPNPSKRWRSITFHQLDTNAVDLTFALGDETHEGPVDVQVLPRGSEPISLTLSKPGQEIQQRVSIPPGEGPALVIKARSSDPGWKHLIVEGRMQ